MPGRAGKTQAGKTQLGGGQARDRFRGGRAGSAATAAEIGGQHRIWSTAAGRVLLAPVLLAPVLLVGSC